MSFGWLSSMDWLSENTQVALAEWRSGRVITMRTRCEYNTIRFCVAADGSWHFAEPVAMSADEAV
jgi:hypothetical protein